MPALSYTLHLQKRLDSGGRNFSIIFAVIAFVIVTGCLFWGIFLPKYRKKHPRRPRDTRYNHRHVPQTFPSHPALLRKCHTGPSGRPRTYDPRSQTPFPNTPPPGDCINLPPLTPRLRSAQNLAPSQNEVLNWSPARDRLPSRRGLNTVASAGSGCRHEGQDMRADIDDFILPIPQALALCPKSAGRAPTLARQLNQFPIPRSGSDGTGKLAHPRKLFEDLEERYSKSTSITSLGTPSPMPLNTERQTELVKHDLLNGEHGGPLNSNPVLAPGLTKSSDDMDTKGAELARSGTITKPKTPVAEIRTFYDREAFTKAGESSKSGTISSIDFPDSTFSSLIQSGTPPTSPLLPYKHEEFRDHRADLVTPTPNLQEDGNTPSSMALPASDRLARMDTIHEGKKEESRVGRIFNRGLVRPRPRPARLNLSFNAKPSSVKKGSQRHSMSSLSSLLMPRSRANRPSVQASSIYSRDTRGVSFARSPTTPAFSDRPSLDGDVGFTGGPPGRKASSLDLLRTKIDDWDLHMDFSTSPSSELKRALSDFGPGSPTFPTDYSDSRNNGKEVHTGDIEQSIPKICVGRPSDDIFRDPLPDVETGRVLKRVIDMEVAQSMASLTRSPSKGSAPGGADWI